jgi:protein ImuB
VIPEGAEAEALAKLPITALDLDEEHTATFALWGISTLGDLAALPEAELAARIGPQVRRWRALAQGEAEHAFVPIEAEFALEEFYDFESPAEQIDSLLFVGARMIDCLVARAAGRALAIGSFAAEMTLEGGRTPHRVVIRPAVATTDRRFLLKLLQLEIGAHPPQAAVITLTLRAAAGQQSKVQLGLFAPQTPEPSRLDVTLARLRAMVGEERVGSPVLEDTHRPEGFRMEGFSLSDFKNEASTPRRKAFDRRDAGKTKVEANPRMALRRVRPPRPVRVMFSHTLPSPNAIDKIRAIPDPRIGTSTPQMRVCLCEPGTWGTRPVAFSDEGNLYEIDAAYGPWRTNGCWWSLDAWDMEEWDVLAAMSDGRSVVCLLTHDRMRNVWQLGAFYD